MSRCRRRRRRCGGLEARTRLACAALERSDVRGASRFEGDGGLGAKVGAVAEGGRVESSAVTREAWGGAGTRRGQRGGAGRSWSRTALETARARPPRSFLTFSRPVHLPPPPIHRGPSRGPITAVWQIAARAVCASHSCICPAPPLLAFLVYVFHLFWLPGPFFSVSFARGYHRAVLKQRLLARSGQRCVPCGRIHRGGIGRVGLSPRGPLPMAVYACSVAGRAASTHSTYSP